MPRAPRPIPRQLGDEFSVATAIGAGVSRRRLRHPSLERPFRGTRLRRRDDTPAPDAPPAAREHRTLRDEMLRRARAIAAIAPPGWFFSHVTAAVIWGLPVPLRLLRDALQPDALRAGIDVAVLGNHRGSKAAGVRGHQLATHLTTVVERDGLCVTDAATTWAQLAPLLSIDELIAVGDAIVYIPRRRGMVRGVSEDALATPAQLEAAVTAGRRHGAAKLRAALGEIRVGSASPAETRVRLACLADGLPEPTIDIDLFDAEGAAIGFTELAYPEYRVLIEYEGDHHRTDTTQWARDIEKHAACAAAGWDVVRLTAAHVYPDARPAVNRIRAALVRRGWRPE